MQRDGFYLYTRERALALEARRELPRTKRDSALPVGSCVPRVTISRAESIFPFLLRVAATGADPVRHSVHRDRHRDRRDRRDRSK